MDQLIDAFTLERIGKAGAKFDIQKAQWFNQQYIRNKSDEELLGYLMSALTRENIETTAEKAKKIVSILKERVIFPNDFWEQGKLFFIAPASFDEQIVAKKWNDDAVKVLQSYKQEINLSQPLTATSAKELLEKVTANLGIKTSQILQILRMTLTGGPSGPDLMITIEILGNAEVEKRIAYALETLKIKIA